MGIIHNIKVVALTICLVFSCFRHFLGDKKLIA